MKIPNAIDGIPFEVRPVRGDPAEARRRALASMNATMRARPSLRRTAQPVMTPHPAFCECVGCSYSRTSSEQAQLERRRRARPKGRTDLRGRRELAKVRDRRDVREARRIRRGETRRTLR